MVSSTDTELESEELTSYTSETVLEVATHGQSLTAPGYGTGRRKEAVARVRLIPGTGVVTVNGRAFEEYFANKLQPEKRNPGGGFSDPAKQPGVMEVPLVDSMEKWTEMAQTSQAILKKKVTE